MNQKKSQPKVKISPKKKIEIGIDNPKLSKLKNSDRLKFLTDLISGISDVVYATDLHLKVTYWNRAAEDVYGLNEADVLGRSILEVTGSKFDPKLRENLTRELLEKGSVRTQVEHRTKSGSIVFFDSITTVHQDTNGNPVGFLALNREITELKQSAETVRLSQKMFSGLVENAPFGIYVVDSGFRISNMNRESQTGAFKNVRPLIGRDFCEAMHILWPDSVAEGIIANFRHTLTTGEPYYSPRFTNPRHDADIVESYEWELHRLTLPDGQFGVICYYYDSTKLREAEKEVRESEEKYRRIVETANEGIITTDIDGCITFVNNKMAGMLGYTAKELTGKRGIELIAPEEISLSNDRIKLRKAGNTDSYDIKFICKNGEFIWMHANGTPVYNPEGLHIGNLGMYTDITKNKLAEEALQKSEEKYRRIIETASEGIIMGGSDGKINYVNRKMADMLGYSVEELVGKPGIDFVTEEQKQKVLDGRAKLKNKIQLQDEFCFVRKNGSLLWTYCNGAPIFNDVVTILEIS